MDKWLSVVPLNKEVLVLPEIVMQVEQRPWKTIGFRLPLALHHEYTLSFTTFAGGWRGGGPFDPNTWFSLPPLP